MRHIITTSLLAVVCAFAFACGDGDDDRTDPDASGDASSIEEYFDELQRIDTDAEERANEVFDDVADPLSEDTSFEEARAAFDQVGETLQEVADEVIAELEDLDPPAELADLHGEMIDGYRDVREALGNTFDELADAEEESDFFLILNKFEGIDSELNEACRDLIAFAADNGIDDLELSCNEADGGGTFE